MGGSKKEGMARLMWRVCLFLCVTELPLWGQAQPSQAAVSYVFPIRPTQRNYLSAGYGELRGTHFHTALDIRTQGRTGWAVHATEAGYVSRVKIQLLGYGRALYLQHPNGYTSVYAHLQAFSEKLEQWTVEQQYAQRSFEIDVCPVPGQFPVQRQEIMARSGNTGGSTGPHLHFELRDEKQRALDPLRLGKFTEIVDTRPPQIERLAFQTMHIDARINGQFGRFEVPVHGQQGKYHVQVPLQLQGCIGVELLARDLYEHRKSGAGLSELRLLLNGKEHFVQYVDALDFTEQRHIAVHMNYAQYVLEDQYFSKLYVDEGNVLPFYRTNKQRGWLCFEKDAAQQPLYLQLWDPRGNHSELQVMLNTGEQARLLPSFNEKLPYGYIIQGNTLLLHIKTTHAKTRVLLAFAKAHKEMLALSYQYEGHNVYLWDLRQGIPTEAYSAIRYKRKPTLRPFGLDVLARVPSGMPYSFSNEHLRIDFSSESLYDTLYLRFEKQAPRAQRSEIFYFKNKGHPLKKDIDVVLKPQDNYLWQKTSAYRIDKEEMVFHETAWEYGEAHFQSDALGPFVLLTDTTAPYITRTERRGDNKIRFYVTDNLSDIAHWEATLNGRWLLLEYFQKQGFLQTKTLPGRPLSEGKLTISLQDQQQNMQTYTYHIKP